MSEAILPAQAIAQTNHREKEWSPAKVIYTILMALALLSHIWLMVIGAGIDNIPTYIWILRLLPVPFAICLGKLWKDRGFQILSLYFLLFFFRCFIPNPGSIFSVEMAESILSALWLFAACYGLARVLTASQLKGLLIICSIIWVSAITVFSCLGIYTVWTEKTVYLLANGAIKLNNMTRNLARLDIVYTSTTTGAILSITILVDILIAIQVKNKVVKLFILAALIPIIIAMAFSDSRTAIINVAVGIAVMTFFGILCLFSNKGELSTNRIKKRKSWVIATLFMIIVFIVFFLIVQQIVPIFNQIKTRGIIPKALAEGTERVIIANRGFEGTDILSGRKELWDRIIDYINHNKQIIISGVSKLNPMAGFNEYFGHCHNIYLQIILESGIPGLLLFILFIVHTMKNAAKNIQKTGHQTWIYLLPAIPISLWIADLAECYTWLRSSFCPMTTILFVSIGMINAQRAFKTDSNDTRHTING